MSRSFPKQLLPNRNCISSVQDNLRMSSFSALGLPGSRPSHIPSSPMGHALPPTSPPPSPIPASDDLNAASDQLTINADEDLNNWLGSETSGTYDADIYELPQLSHIGIRVAQQPRNSHDLLEVARARRAVCQAKRELANRVLAEQILRTRICRQKAKEADDDAEAATDSVGIISAMVRSTGGSLYSPPRRTRGRRRVRADTSDSEFDVEIG
ncbi:hypothetical protein BJ138DRAFT_1107724 [Hygrophoropsis aurantiaca]|uniref:Uncharacterized protein n=1 Tax=Hygrophoropsis aurantiaca TaxID=72124 RepID=A0ACB7ZRJ3_9AGAM|nr:hypothetical protein BJ138DRAFT_1107724 [Hygrophoropsis aurantiaca]